VDGHPDWNPGMKRGRMQAVQRALNWAVKQGRIEQSPVAFVEKPPPGKREVVIDYPTYQRMRELTWTQEFRDLIDVSWETGCRPQEIWRVEKRHLDVAGKRWVFPAKESKGKRKIRIVYLTDLDVEVCQRLAVKYSTGPLFRNSDGVPWNRHAASCVFLRMKKHLSPPGGDRTPARTCRSARSRREPGPGVSRAPGGSPGRSRALPPAALPATAAFPGVPDLDELLLDGRGDQVAPVGLGLAVLDLLEVRQGLVHEQPEVELTPRKRLQSK
jgi:integrase